MTLTPRRVLRAVLVLTIAFVPQLFADEHQLNTPPAGFESLFNGQDLTGWKGSIANPATRDDTSPEELSAAQDKADQSMRSHWQVIDGLLHFDGRGENLCTIQDYENFELFIDWKIESGGDSGIYLRGSPQVQIWDASSDGENRAGSGGLFNNRKHSDQPLVRADKPVGQWNTFYIMMMGDRVSVKLNGKLVVDDVVLENYWDRNIPIRQRGPIELQSHGHRLWFRNIFLRELPKHPSPPWQTLFDGTNLEQWEYQRFGWRIDDDLLTMSRRRRNREGENYIWSKQRFGDFIIDLEFKLSTDCDSGIIIRADDRENWLDSGIEIQLRDSFGAEEAGTRDCGAIHDKLAPRVNAVRPAEHWNHMKIVAQDNLISVVLNEQRIVDTDLNQWQQVPQISEDTSNKSKTIQPERSREGHIGLRDEGHPAWFRNIRIKRLQ